MSSITIRVHWTRRCILSEIKLNITGFFFCFMFSFIYAYFINFPVRKINNLLNYCIMHEYFIIESHTYKRMLELCCKYEKMSKITFWVYFYAYEKHAAFFIIFSMTVNDSMMHNSASLHHPLCIPIKGRKGSIPNTFVLAFASPTHPWC